MEPGGTGEVDKGLDFLEGKLFRWWLKPYLEEPDHQIKSFWIKKFKKRRRKKKKEKPNLSFGPAWISLFLTVARQACAPPHPPHPHFLYHWSPPLADWRFSSPAPGLRTEVSHRPCSLKGTVPSNQKPSICPGRDNQRLAVTWKSCSRNIVPRITILPVVKNGLLRDNVTLGLKPEAGVCVCIDCTDGDSQGCRRDLLLGKQIRNLHYSFTQQTGPPAPIDAKRHRQTCLPGQSM